MSRAPLHWSNLKVMAECPADYLHALQHGVTTTPAMRFGALVHAMVLNKAPRSFVVYEKDRRGNAWRDFKAAHEGMEIVTSAEWERASACSDAIKADPVARKVLSVGAREHQLEWKVGERRCAGTPDLNGEVLVDVKVTDPNPFRFGWHARKMGWHGQMAWYRDGIEAATGRKIERVSIIAVRPKARHSVVVFDLSEKTLTEGTKLWRALFERLAVCEASDSWPDYSQCPLPWDLVEDDDFALTIGGEEVEF